MSYDVLTVSIHEVTERADELHPDIILLDVRLNGEKGGIEVAQQIKSRYDIPIIFIANADEATVRRAIAAEPDSILIKPLDALELRAAIEIAMRRHGIKANAHESDRRIREITESLSEVIFETDMAGNITFVNRAGLNEFGYTREHVEAGITLYDLVPPDKHNEIRESIAQAVIDESSQWVEVPGVRRDGSTFPVSVRASLIVREGVPVGIRGIALNVTERKSAEAALIMSERHTREITDALPIVVYETDATGRIIFVNGTAFDLFGYTREELQERMSLFQLIAPADRKRAHRVFRRRMAGEDIGRVEYTGLRKDRKTFPIAIRAVIIRRDGAVGGLRGVILDTTELKRAEEQTREHAHTMEILNLVVTEGSRSTDVQSFAEAATNLTLELMHFDAGAIHLADDDARYAHLRYAIGIPDTALEALESIPLTEAPYARFLAEAKPFFVDGHEASCMLHVAKLGLKSLAAVPLYRRDKIVGALTVGSFSRHTFSQAEQERLAAIGNEVGAAIANLQADEALKEGARRIRGITDALPELVYETDATGTFTFVNASCLKMFGYAKEEFEGKLTVFDVIIPQDTDRGQESFGHRIDSTELGWVEFTALRKDGSTLPISVSARPIYHDGVVIGTRGIAADNTLRKRSEERLRESEAYYRAIFESTATGMAILEEDMTVAMGNSKLEQLTGFRKNDVEGLKPFTEFVAPEDLERITTYHRARRRDAASAPKEYEFRLLRKDGTRREVFVTAALIPGTKRSVASIVDVSALKTAQEAVRKQAAMLDAAHDAVMTLDPEGTITYWNRGAERLYGWTTHEAEGQNANALLHTRFPESREALWPKLIESGLWEGELINVTRDGVEVTVASSWTLMTDGKDNASAILEISSDITERKKAESALAESEAKLHITFATMADGIVIVGLDYKVTDCNEAILRLTQRSREEIIGKPLLDLFAPEFRSLILDARKFLVGAVLARTEPSRGKKETVRTDSQLLQKNGERVDIEANISTIEDASGQPAEFLIVARDVTERKQMEYQLDSSLVDLQRSNAELEQFAYVTSHDLQEPLRMITSYIQIIEEDYKGKLDADADQYIAFAVEGAKRMHTLINDLLAYSRVGTRGEPFMPVIVSNVLSAAAANLEVAIEESHAVVTHDRLPTVLGDESQLIQLFQNLLGNAIKFRSDATPMIHIGVEEAKDEWVFSVRDNGIGIDMKYAERIFVVFQRLHAREDYPGTGVGLAVVKKIVERHRGRIWVESEPAKGSTFFFTLPKGGIVEYEQAR
jgi:PAS domain S-box-containing protein